MNIIFLSPNGQLNGPRRRIHNFSTFLANNDHQVNVYCKSFFHSSNNKHNSNFLKIQKEIIENVNVHWVPSISYSTNGLRRLISELQFVLISFFHIIIYRRSAEVLIADSVSPINGFFGLLISKICRFKFIHQIRDVWPIALVYDGALSKNSISYKVLKYLELIQYKNCDWICTTLPNVHSYIKSNRGDETKISYIRNGVNIKEFEYSEYIPGKIINVVYLGTISHAHDVISVIKAFKLLKDIKLDHKFNLNIYGDGVKKKQCEEYCRYHDLTNVSFHGSVQRNKVPEILHKGDILVSPVLNSKAYIFGINLNKNYDYFAAGRTVLLSSPLKINEVTIANAGYSCPAEDPKAILNALVHFESLTDEDKKKFANNARKYALKEFDSRLLAAKFESMLLNVSKIKN